MVYYNSADPEHIKRERRKAQELRQTQWWKQQIGRGVCYHCGGTFSKELLTMDHLVPIARGGRSTKSNCVVSCKDCNSAKGALMTVEITLRDMQARGEFAESTEGTGESDQIRECESDRPSELGEKCDGGGENDCSSESDDRGESDARRVGEGERGDGGSGREGE